MNLVHEGVLPPNEPDDRDERREEREMAQERETLADILAEMRREVGGGTDTYCGKRIIRRMEDDRVRQYCDRIEAAWKREREELERYAASKMLDGATIVDNRKGGNAAAMYEALVRCSEIALQWQADEADGVAGTTDKTQARSAAEAVIDMEFEINAALAAPARNCDRFNHKDPVLAKNGAVQHWQNETDCAVDFGQWLLAPAAERKGEGDGR